MKERRISNHTPLTVFRGAEGEASRTVRGYAVVFGSESVDLGGFTEVIEPNALDGVVEQSDVMAVLNHDINRGLLARSRKGEGSLSLEVDDKGLRYEFEAPKTALGDELLESIKRGDIDKSSFCFTVGEDVWEKRSDGSVLRTIKKIDRLFDISPVYSPAYEATEVITDARGLENLNNNTDTIMNKKDKRSKAEAIEKLKAILAELQDEEPQEAPQDDEEQKAQPDEDENGKGEEAPQPDEDEKPNEDEAPKDEEAPQDDEEPAQDEKPKDEAEEKGCGEGDEKKRKSTNVRMKNKFSLLKAINDVVNNRQFDDVTADVIKEGRSAMRNSNINVEGQITIPFSYQNSEARDNGIFAQVVTQGAEAIATDKLSILEPLRANMVLAEAGAQFITGAVGNISLPRMSKSSSKWKGEVAKADNGEGAFDEIMFQPKRLTSVIEVSNLFLQQTDASAEALLRNDLIKSISDKLEATILSNGAGDTNTPAGLFNGVTADTAAFKFKDIVDDEERLESADLNGDYTYILSPKAKAAMRVTPLDAGSGRFVYENGEVQGSKALVTSNVVDKGYVLGKFSELVVVAWGGINLVIDNISKADYGITRIVVNSYWDVKPRRDEAFVKRIIK